MQFNRRHFLKTAGATALKYTGILNGALFQTADWTLRFFKQKATPSHETYRPQSFIPGHARTLLVAVGKQGMAVADLLNPENNSVYIKKDINLISILRFDPQNINNKELISGKHIIFLAGSVYDKDFWTARNMIAGVGGPLFIMLISSTELYRSRSLTISNQNEESIIQIPGKDYAGSAAKAVLAVVSPVNQQLVGLDFGDVLHVLSRKYLTTFYVEGTLDQVAYMLKRKFQSLTLPSGVFISFHDAPGFASGLATLTNLLEIIYPSLTSKEEMVLSISDLVKINSGVRISIILNNGNNPHHLQ